MFTIGDFANANEIPVEEIDERRFSWLLTETEALIRAYRPGLPEDVSEWPKAAEVVAMRVMSRSYNAGDVPVGASQQQVTAGSFSHSTSFSSDSTGGGVWLTKQDRILLRGRGGGAYGVDTMPTDRPYRSAALRHCDVWGW